MSEARVEIAIVITPGFNMAATIGFLDPLRAANYLIGDPVFRWALYADANTKPTASNGLAIKTEPLSALKRSPHFGVISTSWTPEAHYGAFDALLRRWSRFGTSLVGLDTGAFVLAAAGLLDGYRATVHYEHMDAFAETYPDVALSEDLYVIDRDRLTASGGGSAIDLGLQIVRSVAGQGIANSAARYVFHERLRPEGTRQLPDEREPTGIMAPEALRRAIQVMEENLEEVAPMPVIAERAGISQRRMERLFRQFVGKSPVRYYSDIRLDRARGLVTQTDLPLHEIALACGFASPEHFSRAYRARFGVTARTDRIEGRVPFEFRAWPMHVRGGQI